MTEYIEMLAIFQDDGGGWVRGHLEDMPEIVGYGQTVAEARTALQEAFATMHTCPPQAGGPLHGTILSRQSVQLPV